MLLTPALTASAAGQHRVVVDLAMQAPAPGSNYKVQDGDSLYSIASDMGIADSKLAAWVEDFLELNDMEDADSLQAGQTVKIPGQAASSTPTLTQTSGQNSAAGSRAYTVQNGDTLYSIGANLNVPDDRLYTWVQDTMTLNSMDDGDVLTVGKSIQISTRNVPVPKPITAPYTVKAGDTLHEIADKQGVSGAGLSSWTSLVLELNSLSSADMLAEGQLLQLPVSSTSNTSTSNVSSTTTASSTTSSGPSSTSQNVSLTRPAATTTYVVKPGDTLEAIGIAQKVSETQLRGWIEDVRKLNKLNEEAFITEGQKIELPALSVAPPAGSTTTTTTTTTSQSTTTADPPRPPAASVSSTTVVPNTTTTTTTPSTTNNTSTTNSTLQNAPRSMTGCFYVIKAEDDLSGIARKVGVATTGVDAWIAQVKQMNGVDFKVMPVGTAIQMPC